MGNKQNKTASTELTPKRSYNYSNMYHSISCILDIAMLKANTKYSERGNSFFLYNLESCTGQKKFVCPEKIDSRTSIIFYAK